MDKSSLEMLRPNVKATTEDSKSNRSSSSTSSGGHSLIQPRIERVKEEVVSSNSSSHKSRSDSKKVGKEEHSGHPKESMDKSSLEMLRPNVKATTEDSKSNRSSSSTSSGGNIPVSASRCDGL